MHESEPRGSHLALIIEDNVKRILLSANTILLTAVRVNLDLDKLPHLLVETQAHYFIRFAIVFPDTSSDVILER